MSLYEGFIFILLKEMFVSAEYASTIEIGLEQAPIVVFVYFFPHLNMQKTC
jgi:hypothetical protein